MPEQWKAVCKVKEIPLDGAYAVARGLAWQDLPKVEVFRHEGDLVVALLEGGVRHYADKVEDGKVYLDVNELNAPASRAEAALAGSYAVLPHV